MKDSLGYPDIKFISYLFQLYHAYIYIYTYMRAWMHINKHNYIHTNKGNLTLAQDFS